MDTALRDFKLKESYYKLVQDKIQMYLDLFLYIPMFEIAGLGTFKAKNSLSTIEEALRDGRIYYDETLGGFKANLKFTNLQAKELEKLGAVFDKFSKSYQIPILNLPEEIRKTLDYSILKNAERVNKLNKFLKYIENNLDSIIDQMLFTNEVITVLDDAQGEVKKNVKKINVIEPELTDEQKQEMAKSYNENLKFYIKDFQKDKIPRMREKIGKLVLEGYREDTIQKFLEKEYKIDQKKAKFLAQNETSIMLAQYKKQTYKEMGYRQFKWLTIMDGRERPLHKEHHGKIYNLDNPPVIDERTGQRGLPGETYNCRCTMQMYRSNNVFSV